MFVELARLLDPTDTPRTLSLQRQNPACPRKTSRGPLCFQKTLEEGEHGLALPSFRTHSFGKCFQMSDSTPLACNIVAYFKKKKCNCVRVFVACGCTTQEGQRFQILLEPGREAAESHLLWVMGTKPRCSGRAG